MKITDVEAIVLRQAVVDDGIADGSQDDLVIRIHTDEGITGIGEVDSSPELVRALVQAPSSHAVATSLRDALLGEDPLDVERLWHKMYRGLIYFGRRGIAIHAISGLDIALWDIKGKALGKPVYELLGTPQRDRVRAYASRLMPDTPAEVTDAVAELRDLGFTAVKLGWGPLGKDPRLDVELAAAARSAGGDGVEIMIDAGLGYVADAKTAIGVAREYEQLGVYWLEEPFEPDEYEAYAELADTVDLRVTAGEQDVDVVGVPRADRSRARRRRPARRDPVRRHHRDDQDRGAGTVARHRDRSSRLEERHHQGRVAALQRGHARRDLAGVLRRGHPDQHQPDRPAASDRGGRLRRGADGSRPRRRPRRGCAREPQNRRVRRTRRATRRRSEP